MAEMKHSVKVPTDKLKISQKGEENKLKQICKNVTKRKSQKTLQEI